MKERFCSELQRPGADPLEENREMYISKKGRKRKVNKRVMNISCCPQCSRSYGCSDPWVHPG